MEDCMSITRQIGKNPLVWDDIKSAILLLREEEYYKNESVKLGKFKGKETLKYVDSILERFHKYSAKP
jgi:membrane-bound lytic murein transglycosylase F